MSARRIAVLVGSHDPAYFARDRQPDRPSETEVLAALRTHPSRGAPDGAGPSRLRAFAAARTRRPVGRARERMFARAITGV
jgi:hypothetical protein